MSISVSYVNIFVSDFNRAVAFYSEVLGFEVSTKDESFGYCSFKTSPTSFAIAKAGPDQGELVGRHTGVGLMVKDLDAVAADLKAKGVEFAMEPEKQPWGGYMSLIKDTEGNILYLDQMMAH